MTPDLVPIIDKVAVHAGTAVGAVRKCEGRSDILQIDHVLQLKTTGGVFLPGEEPALANSQNTAHLADWKACVLRCGEGKDRRFLSFTKKASPLSLGPMARQWRPIFKISRSCFRTAFSRRNRFSSPWRWTGASACPRASRSWLSQHASVDNPTPRSSAFSLRVRPLGSASRTASSRNSGIGLFPFPREHLPVSLLVLSTFAA